MYPILILRSEITCLVILIFLAFTSRIYNVGKTNRTFKRILIFSFIHVILDIITVITVNNTNTIPAFVNWICHILFYLSAIFYAQEVCNYAIKLSDPSKAKPFYILGHTSAAIYICLLPLLKIEYLPYNGTYSSTGTAAYFGYGLALVYFVAAITIILFNLNKMPLSIKQALIPMLFIGIAFSITQTIWKEILFTGSTVTIITVGFFFSLANPVEVFKKKALTDALTGVGSRSSFEEDIAKYDIKFKKAPNEDYIFVFCDINDLRNVNNQFGHSEGDNYISLIAQSIRNCMNHATHIYRTGGDEFLVVYIKTDEKIVVEEIKKLNDECKKASAGVNYKVGISSGYAKSSANYKSLQDVIKAADYVMYENKAKIKSGVDFSDDSLGAKLNYSGLTDKMFDVMCASSEKSYPFITNLETGATRIDPRWENYFGLESDYFADFMSIWKERIHPDDFEGYMNDIAALMNGHQKYHNYDYFAKKADGEYVKVSCHGSLYKDVSTGTQYFTGYIENHGLDSNIDPTTGLKNFDSLVTLISEYMEKKQPFSVVKFKLNNLARIDMLYSYGVGDELLKQIAILFEAKLKGIGHVFCKNAISFSVVLDISESSKVEQFYKEIQEACFIGFDTSVGKLPIEVSGGAVINNGKRYEISRIRSNLVSAVDESRSLNKNKLVIYENLNGSDASTDISILTEIHTDALSGMKFFKLYYQPIVDVKTNKTIGAEALLRWDHPTLGLISPASFIDFLENDPCYYNVGIKIIEDAVRDAKEFEKFIPGFHISVNITAIQLRDEHFADNIFEVLEKYDYSPKNIILELTERCKELDNDFLSTKIKELRDRGLMVAFDDLGTGYSTLNLLMNIPVDEIKLDGKFVKDLAINKSYQIFTKALALGSSSENRKYTICFEGIENEETLNLISSFGNYLVQGYYFSKPIPAEEFIKYIE